MILSVNSLQIDIVESVEPESTTMISSHHATLSRQRRICRSSLQQTTKAEIDALLVFNMQSIETDNA
jgi:hypothetical protein